MPSAIAQESSQSSPSDRMPARAGVSTRRRWFGLAAFALGVVCCGALALWARLAERASAQGADDPAFSALEFCAPVPVQAEVAPGSLVDRRYGERVPLDNPPPDAVISGTNYRIAKNEVVRFDVSSPRRGAITVHGLHDLKEVRVGSTVTITFRAIYTGRFPLHFHGVDGSHFELAALEVLPSSFAYREP